MTEIINTADMAENVAFDEDAAPLSDMAATTDSDPAAQIEFHVQMRRWTIREMEELIIEAGASQLIRSFGDAKFRKLIEDRAIEAVTAKADAKIDAVTTDIIDQPLTPDWGDKTPITMREFIGLYAKEYLTEKVDREGRPSKGGYMVKTYTRAELAVMRAMDAKFSNEITSATNEMIADMRKQIRAAHEAVLAEEKARIRKAISKMTT